MHAPVGRAGKTPGRMRGNVSGLMQRFGIGGGERLDPLHIRTAVWSGNARLEESQHLVQRFRKMYGSTLRENVRAVVNVPEPEAQAAQHEVLGIRGIAAADREAPQHARWSCEAPGSRNFPHAIRRDIGAAHASALGKARAYLQRMTGHRFQGIDDRRECGGRRLGRWELWG
jgi:hypothetical protein